MNEAEVTAAFMRATLHGIGEGLSREFLESHPIACPRCGKPMPFEPRSEYRRRKHAAVARQLDAVAGLVANDAGARPLGGIAADVAQALLGLLATDYPLEGVREMTSELRVVVHGVLEQQGAVAGNHPVTAIIYDMMAIAEADVGERTDLPEAAPDEASEKLDALVTSSAALARDRAGSGERDRSAAEFRARQRAGVMACLEAIIAETENDPDAAAIRAIAARNADALLRKLESNPESGDLRSHVETLRLLMWTDCLEIAVVGLHPARLLLNEMLDVAEADIGERDDLPSPPFAETSDAVKRLLSEVEADRQRSAEISAAIRKVSAENESSQTVSPPSSRCFIATAACGTSCARDVIALCDFRERVLRPSPAGRRVIAWYERFSPPLAALIARSRLARFAVRHGLIRPARIAAHAFVRFVDHGLRPLRQLRPPR